MSRSYQTEYSNTKVNTVEKNKERSNTFIFLVVRVTMEAKSVYYS